MSSCRATRCRSPSGSPPVSDREASDPVETTGSTGYHFLADTHAWLIRADVSPNRPPCRSCSAATQSGGASFGCGGTICSRSMRRNIGDPSPHGVSGDGDASWPGEGRAGGGHHDAGQADQRVDDAAQRRRLAPEQGRDEVELEEADQAPVDGPDDHQEQRDPVERSHAVIPFGYWKSSDV